MLWHLRVKDDPKPNTYTKHQYGLTNAGEEDQPALIVDTACKLMSLRTCHWNRQGDLKGTGLVSGKELQA
jgi:hypothetical protein